MSVQLNFREKGIPKHVKRRAGLLITVFFISLVIFQIMLNRTRPATSMEMSKATLPVVSANAYGRTVAEIHGYRTQMDASYMRDAIVPLDEDRNMSLDIDTYGYDIESVSYEIRSLNTERKIADTVIENIDLSADNIHANIQVENLVDADEEYLFILKLHNSDEDVFYYTRIMMPGNENIRYSMDFADVFRQTAMSTKYQELAKYVETSDYADKDTLSDVSIHSTVEQIGWKRFKGEMVSEPVVEITDVNESYVSLIYEYQMKDDNRQYYNVEEYFKLRYTVEQIYLLDYHRTMNQILTEGSITASNNILRLGVTSEEPEYLSNETGTVVGFVQEGELYEYDQNARRLTKVFGFIDMPTDERDRFGQHDIKILNMDENGNMDFVVYGYMNRGSHEGRCGINLYHYDSAGREAVEQVFISTTHPYQILDANFSDLLYENAGGDFYIMYGGTLARIGHNKMAAEELITNLKSDQYAVSSSGQYVAWSRDDGMGNEINVMDLESEETRTIKSENDSLIRPLAFMTEDLVYGIASRNDVRADAAGSTIYAMSDVRIVDTSSRDFAVLKEYSEDGFYVTDVRKDGYTLYLDRVSRQGEEYVSAEGDTIKDSAGLQNKMVETMTSADDMLGTVRSLVMTELPEGAHISSIAGDVAGLARSDVLKDMSIVPASVQKTYFVYVGNEVVMTTQNLTRAIARADDEMAIVIDNMQNYIWKRGKSAYVNAFPDVEVGSMDVGASTSAGSLSAMLARDGMNTDVHSLLDSGKSPIGVLEDNLDNAVVLDLTGCTLSEVLYYVSEGTPVYAGTGDGEAVLIIGYDAANIIYYRPDIDRNAKMTMAEAAGWFESAGNVYISYVR